MLGFKRFRQRRAFTLAVLVSITGCSNIVQPAASTSTQLSPRSVSEGASIRVDASDDDAKRTIYVSNIVTNTVTAYDGLGREKRQITGFSRPLGMDIAPNGDLYVADAGHNEVKIFLPGASHPLRTLRSAGVPLDVKISKAGIVGVVNQNRSASFFRLGADQPCRKARFEYFSELNMGAFDEAGNFYVDGFIGGTTGVARTTGGCRPGPTLDSEVSNIGQVGGIAVNSKGQVVIADADQRTLFTYAYNKEGRLAIVFTTTLVETGTPWAFSLTSDGRRAFVADGAGGWESYHYPFARLAVHKASGIQEPVGIAISPDGAP